MALLVVALLPVKAALSAESPPPNAFADLSMAEVEQAIETTQETLDQLPSRLIRESGGTLGFRSNQKVDQPQEAWVEVDLKENRRFDTIVLVPAVIIDENKVISNHIFPERFQIRSYASAEDEIGQLLFDSTIEPLTPYPNQSPVIIDCPGASAQRIRFIPLELHQLLDLPQYLFALSELLVFDGNQNLALGKPVTAKYWTEHSPIWHKKYLTDGYMPYSEPSARTDGKINCSRMLIPPESKTPASITLDLGSEQLLDEIRLYPIHMDRNYAVFHKAAMGFPQQFKIEVSKNAAFTSPTVIFDTGSTDYPSPGHRLACFSAKSATGRFVRITATRLPTHPRRKGFIYAFAEIEVLAQGDVISRGAKVALSHRIDIRKYPASMLVDGISANGTILPMRSWLAELAERNRLEVKLAALQSELQARYLRQSRIVHALRWGIGIAILLTIVVYFWQRLVRQSHIYRLRENLAADLHDEIGGNFSGIALLSDELAHEEDMPEAHIQQLISIAEISRTSANNARTLVRFLESRHVRGELLGEMQATAELLLTKHHYTFEIDGYKYVKKLAPKEKWHLLLFFKEALNNIAKHAQAREVKIQLQFTAKRLSLSIMDNGHGLDTTNNRPPAHLAMRAQKLKAKLDISTRPDGGTSIQLEKPL